MWRETLGRLCRRSMMKSWPFGFSPMARSIAADSRSLSEEARNARRPVEVPYDALGERETLLYLSEPSENAAYDELRAEALHLIEQECVVGDEAKLDEI